MALIGNGAQSEFQAIAFHHMLGIRELRLFDTDPARHRQTRCSICAALRLSATFDVIRCASTRRGGARRRHRHHRHRRQVQRH